MGLIRNGAAALAAAGFLCAAGLHAAPRLRLVLSTVGPVSIAQGASGGASQTQTVEAYNDADGSLNLKLASSVPWIVATAGAQRNCSSRPGVCIPLQFALNMSGLAAGISTGIVTVSDPNAVDAPRRSQSRSRSAAACLRAWTCMWRQAAYAICSSRRTARSAISRRPAMAGHGSCSRWMARAVSASVSLPNSRCAYGRHGAGNLLRKHRHVGVQFRG